MRSARVTECPSRIRSERHFAGGQERLDDGL